MQIEPVTLEGQHVRLEPVRLEHVPALWQVGAYEDIWRYMPNVMRSQDDMRHAIEAELRRQQAGLSCVLSPLPGRCNSWWVRLAISTSSSSTVAWKSAAPGLPRPGSAR